MDLVAKLQPLLKSNDQCLYAIDGSLVFGWTRIPHVFSIVQHEKTTYGLIIFTHPGIGSTETETKPMHTLPMNSQFQFMFNNKQSNPSSQEIQVQLANSSTSFVAEFLACTATNDFISALTCIFQGATETSSQMSYEWLNQYDNSKKSGTEETSISDWPLSEITRASDNTAVAFDIDGDVSTLDKLNSNETNVDDDFEDIVVPIQNVNLQSNPNENNKYELSDKDLVDFDPLSSKQTEEEMIASDLIRRSREVVSNRASAGKTWLERTLTNSNDKNVSFNKNPPSEEENEEFYDVTDNIDLSTNVELSKEAAYYNGVYPAIRSSRSIKGLQARESTIRLLMAAREKEFTECFPFSIFVGTWNVNGQPPTEDLSTWLSSCAETPDVIAVGFQELDLSAEALLLKDSSREDHWIKALESGLPSNVEYFKLKHVRLVGMMLVVYVQTKHRMQVMDVESETNGTGIMGVMGNKGGVAVRFQLHNSTICFVNSHLAAHLTEYERRNQDFREVYTKLKFTLFQPPLSISDHDLVFWLGDLNYRFDELSADDVKACLMKKDYSKLYSFDQLHRQKSAGKCFKGFSEGQLLFQPTYKYDPGTDNWDTSEKGRAPAWCDRILWKGKNIEQLQYTSHPKLKLSDHKPVSGLFSVGIKVVERSKERKVFEEIVRKLDKKENDSLPQVKLEKTEFVFNDVEFMETRADILRVANIGQSPVQYEFIPKLDDSELCKPWIKINKVAGLIMPGDFEEIELAVLVDNLSAPMVTVGNCKLDDILVLHLVDGKDFFVPINGTYIPSVFGSSIEALVRIYGPIRQVAMQTLINLENTALTFDYTDGKPFPDATEPLEIPKELWLLIDRLHKEGMKVENILVQSGIDEDIIKIRRHLDHGYGGAMPGSIYSVGESLLLFLEALPEPVIPYKFHAKCLEACNNYILCKQVITQLPECHAIVFRYLTAFLRELLKHRADNKLDPAVLATVFGSILLRSPMKHGKNPNRKVQAQIAQKKAKFVFHFLINDFRD